jgi:hypothetical protein
LIIGFHGQIGSGKNLAADRLEAMVKLPCIKRAFADKLKESSAALFGFSKEKWDEYKNDPDAVISFSVGGEIVYELTARQFLQRYGTEAHRSIFSDDFWVRYALADVPRDCLLLITDVRFPNELDGIHENGGVVLHMKGIEEREVLHDSEQILTGCDFVIHNHIRDDNYYYLDSQLRNVAITLNIPLRR